MIMMRRYIMTYLAAIVAAVSCTGVADLKVTEEPGTLVPIEFAVPMTKGAIYNEHDLVNNSSIFGMFAVDTQAESLNDDDGLNIRNQECRYVAATDKEKASLRFGRLPNDKTLYFPMNSSVAYDFYTYHRWTSKIVEYEDGTMTISDSEDIQTVSEMTSTDRHVDVALGIASQYDVLWAKSVAPAVQDGDGNPIPGYNASYIRKTGNIPSFKFSHPAAGIRFMIVLDPESTEKIYKTDHLRLLTMKFTGAESKAITTEAALRVIDLDDQNLEGKFVASLATRPFQSWINNVGNSGNLNFDLLADADGDGVVETCVKEPVQLSSEHFIMPMDEPLEVTLTLRHDRINSEGTITGRWPEVVKTFTLDPKDFGAAESGYKAGIMYNYKIVVKYVNDTPNTPTNDKIEVAIVPETAPDKVVDIL